MPGRGSGSGRKTGYLFVACLLGSLAVQGVAGHNFIGVWNTATSTHSSSSEDITEHCDGIFSDGLFCVEEDPPIVGGTTLGPFTGFAYTDGRNPFLHGNCQYDVDRAEKDYTVKLHMWEGDVDFDQFDEEPDEIACSRSFEQGVSFDNSGSPDVGHVELVPGSAFEWDVLGGVEVGIQIYAQLNVDGFWGPYAAWTMSWIEEAPVDEPARLVDVQGEDFYREVDDNASRYVIGDESGDDILYIDGLQVPVTDGVPVLAGDVQITRTDAPGLGTDAKNWTVLHTEELPLAVRIMPDGDGREIQVKSFQV